MHVSACTKNRTKKLHTRPKTALCFRRDLVFFTHHAIPPKEIRDDLLVYVVHQPSRTLVVIACIDEEFLAGVFINEWTHLGAEADVDVACS